MNEYDLRKLIDSVRFARISRRRFVEMVVGAGLTIPLAGQLLTDSGIANAQQGWTYKPTNRGGGGLLKLLMWQGPTLLNPHFAVGIKDWYGARVFYEPLAAWDGDANLVPILATEIPTLQNGGLAADGKSVVWKLKRNVQWHDGKPFTADDVVFNWEYAADPATATTTVGIYRDIRVEKIDSHSVRIVFAKPTPFWAEAFVGVSGMLIPKHLFEPYRGAKSREAPANLKPVGTGCYVFSDFRPGDLVTGKINANYHESNRPHFDAIEMKGGGDAVSAARAVLQTGEYDYAGNILVDDDILKRMEAGGKGKISIAPGGSIEMIQLNCTDPWTEVDGERASVKSAHPTLTDPVVREALNMLVDRGSIQEHIYGRTGTATRNFLNQPVRFRSPNNKWEFNVDKANSILDATGWRRGSDGIRMKADKKLKYVFQTSTNASRQKVQALVKQGCQRAGIDIELKSVAPSVYFSSDVANPDTYRKFFCDIQMYSWTMAEPDPHRFMSQFCSWEVANRNNKWQGRNVTRWRNSEYDRTFRATEDELDPIKRAALFIKMNDLLVDHKVVIPLVNRPSVSAHSNRLRAPMSGWDSDIWLLKDWYREA